MSDSEPGSLRSIPLDDFPAAFANLKPDGSNWAIFKLRFLVAVTHKGVEGQFDGSNKRPSIDMIKEGDETETDEQHSAAALAAWQERENLARYLLSLKLPDSAFIKCMRKTTVAEMWTSLDREFTGLNEMREPHLRSKFMGLRYEKGANLRSEFGRVRKEYEALLCAGVKISDDDYRKLIVDFAPTDISDFIATQLSIRNVMDRVFNTPGQAADPSFLMEVAAQEWERLEANREGNGRRGGSRGRGSGCWNCGGRGHKQDVCPSPEQYP